MVALEASERAFLVQEEGEEVEESFSCTKARHQAPAVATTIAPGTRS